MAAVSIDAAVTTWKAHPDAEASPRLPPLSLPKEDSAGGYGFVSEQDACRVMVSSILSATFNSRSARHWLGRATVFYCF
ncbi:hypothetical protein FOZ60_005438 [Perkinsus olseni]|uniref:Uncharacterized protein n=1 Tax=Perkinsus olseni TaxID=32597 RepID=A0A7J6NTD1_PEROL|nr:hypothetical protein FOZ60_005438 [Perkinsus olseni]